MKSILAVISGLLIMVSALPYLKDIVKGKTKPNIVSWATWTLLTSIATVAAFASGAPRAALLTLGATLATLSIVILGLRYGIAKLTKFDLVCQVGAVIGLILWAVFNSPALGLAFTLGIDLTGGLHTVYHAWRKPQEETWEAFFVGGIASILTLLSLSTYRFADLAFPIYFVLFDLIITIIIISRRMQTDVPLRR
jgi:hypothetical protein